MNSDDIIRMAREADQYANSQTGDQHYWKEIRDERFAALVAAAEREACAKVCEEIGPKGVEFDLITQGFAGAIRARGNGGEK